MRSTQLQVFAGILPNPLVAGLELYEASRQTVHAFRIFIGRVYQGTSNGARRTRKDASWRRVVNKRGVH